MLKITLIVVDSDNTIRTFEKETENTKLTGNILNTYTKDTNGQCAAACLLNNMCIRFSYHGDLPSNNCVLGSATATQQSEAGWNTYK